MLRKLSSAIYLAVPLLALGVFMPKASSATTNEDVSSIVSVRLALASQDLTQNDMVVLNEWTDTYNPTPAQIAALRKALQADLKSYLPIRNARYKALVAFDKKHYQGKKLAQALFAAYQKLTSENLNFIKFEYSKVDALLNNGVVSASTYKFIALK